MKYDVTSFMRPDEHVLEPGPDAASNDAELSGSRSLSKEEKAAREVDHSLRVKNLKPVEPSKVFEKKIVLDRIFTTYDQVRPYIVQQLSQFGATFKEILVPQGDAGQSVDDNIYADAAIGLLASAKVALHWKDCEHDPLGAAKMEADRLIEQIKDAQERPNLETLYMGDETWGALHYLAASQDAIRVAECPIPPHVLDSRGQFKVDAIPSVNEHAQIGEIVRESIKRLSDLCSKERQNLLNEMRDWPLWERRILPATPKNVPVIERIYKEAMLPPELLLRLVSSNDMTRTKAREEAEGGGFLHDPDEGEIRMMLETGRTTLLCAEEDNTETAFGYYCVIEDTETVRKMMGDFCGYEPEHTYIVKEDLPQKSHKGWEVQWSKRRAALDLMNSVDHCAIGVEIAVGKNPVTGMKRNSGEATALKHEAYEKITKPQILIRRYEILEVDGIPLQQPVENRASRRFGEALGDVEIGTIEEEFDRDFIASDGVRRKIHLKVLWHLFIGDVQDSLKRINERRG